MTGHDMNTYIYTGKMCFNVPYYTVMYNNEYYQKLIVGAGVKYQTVLSF